MAAVAAVRVAATGMVAAVGGMTLVVSVGAVLAMAMIAVVMVAITIDRPAWRSHDHRWRTRPLNHHDWRRVAEDHPRKWRQRNADADVDTCLGSRSRSEKNRREHC